MNTCRKCGTPFEGKFCPECGTKYVEAGVCPKCGYKNPPEAKYCSDCGSRLDAAPLNAATAKRVAGRVGETVKKIALIAGMASLLIGVICTLIFTFVSGLTVKMEIAGLGVAEESEMMYYYFGDAYSEIDTVRQTILTMFGWNKIGDAREAALLLPVILGTVIVALGMISVTALTAFTGYRVYKRFRKGENVNVIAPAAGVYTAFVAMATGLIILNSAETNGTRVCFSSPTLAGLIVGGVFLGLGIAVIAASDYSLFTNLTAARNTLFALFGTVFAAVVLGMLVKPAITASVTDWDTDSIISTLMGNKAGMGPFTLLESALLTVKDDDVMAKLVAYCLVGGISGIVLIGTTCAYLARKLGGISQGKNKGCLVLGIVNVGIAVLYLTFNILAMGEYSEQVADTTAISYPVAIVVLVFSALAAATEICGLIMNVLGRGTPAPGVAEGAEAEEAPEAEETPEAAE